MKYIEFLGLPGSGKTTFAKEIVSILQTKQINVCTRWDVKHVTMRAMMRKKPGYVWRFIYMLTYFAKYPILDFAWGKSSYLIMFNFIRNYPQLVQQVVKHAESVDPPPWMPQNTLSAERLIRWFFDVACIYQASQDFLRDDDVLLMEEGFCQQTYYLIVAFRKGNINDRKLERYIQLIPKPQLVVAIFTDPTQCERRLQTRPTGIPSKILRSLTVSERIALLEQRMNTYQKIATYLEKQNLPVVRLNNNNNYSSTRKILEETLVHF
jgi:thymidylate kinase